MKKQIIAAAILLGTTAPSFASNFYVLADVGKSKFEVDFDGATYSKTENLLSIGGGYKFSENFAVELAYKDLGEFSETVSESFGTGYYVGKDSFSATALQLSLTGSFALGDAAKIYGRLGVADLEIDAKSSYTLHFNGNIDSESGSESGSISKNKAVLGIGLSYAFTPAFGLRAEYSQYDEWEEITISTTSIGLTYQF